MILDRSKDNQVLEWVFGSLKIPNQGFYPVHWHPSFRNCPVVQLAPYTDGSNQFWWPFHLMNPITPLYDRLRGFYGVLVKGNLEWNPKIILGHTHTDGFPPDTLS